MKRSSYRKRKFFCGKTFYILVSFNYSNVQFEE